MTKESPKDLILFACSRCGNENCTAKAFRSHAPRSCPCDPQSEEHKWRVKQILLKCPYDEALLDEVAGDVRE